MLNNLNNYNFMHLESLTDVPLQTLIICSKVKAVLRVHPGANRKTFEIEDVVIYDAGTGKHDIALLKVKEPATGFETVTLPDCKKVPVK